MEIGGSGGGGEERDKPFAPKNLAELRLKSFQNRLFQNFVVFWGVSKF